MDELGADPVGNTLHVLLISVFKVKWHHLQRVLQPKQEAVQANYHWKLFLILVILGEENVNLSSR